ncbi:MarR family winged helix-turn-helix transcriptional regulator [Amorphoplanes digitatis]|uniref:DNA-binding MarR family transcriptional regulator n=1 Tax=Actinoplanes digitatis TaxID=1868 RepID=A0A7W7MNA1_9ACTN|nr:MarR family transcriptional regulator [Actinoplanes digitatis]MBB4760793.1 DNA-binding MarR family transcriptional regulator [Actinoplanes digitatis]
MTGPESDRPDLAAMAARLARSLVAAERPVLAAHDVSMWGYVVLGALADEPMRTQAALARAIGADKTRIIGTLDELQERALIEREPDPDDRRVRLLRLTPAGRHLYAAVRADIRAGEERLLAGLAEADRRTFLRVLRRLDPADG